MRYKVGDTVLYTFELGNKIKCEVIDVDMGFTNHPYRVRTSLGDILWAKEHTLEPYIKTEPTEAYPSFSQVIREFSTGAVRDSVEGKSPMGLVPMDLIYDRLAPHYGKGADKFGADNWRKGQPKDATYDSLQRHLTAYRRGETDEDHLAAVIWNAFSLMHVDEHLLREHPELDFNYKYPKLADMKETLADDLKKYRESNE